MKVLQAGEIYHLFFFGH